MNIKTFWVGLFNITGKLWESYIRFFYECGEVDYMFYPAIYYCGLCGPAFQYVPDSQESPLPY